MYYFRYGRLILSLSRVGMVAPICCSFYVTGIFFYVLYGTVLLMSNYGFIINNCINNTIIVLQSCWIVLLQYFYSSSVMLDCLVTIYYSILIYYYTKPLHPMHYSFLSRIVFTVCVFFFSFSSKTYFLLFCDIIYYSLAAVGKFSISRLGIHSIFNLSLSCWKKVSCLCNIILLYYLYVWLN
jgi:hypothetical protein